MLYAIDTVVPLISLDQRSTWYPDPHVSGGEVMLWWLNLATLLGWLLSSIFVLVPGPPVPRLGQASCAIMLYRSAGLIRLGYCRPCSRLSPA